MEYSVRILTDRSETDAKCVERWDVMQLLIDHLVICSSTLAEGTAWLEDQLQVTMHPGGTHPALATHNSLLRIGEASYLEVIAPNPTLPDPCRPRWFELDEPIQNAAAKFRSWVARTSDLAATHRISLESGCDPGQWRSCPVVHCHGKSQSRVMESLWKVAESLQSSNGLRVFIQRSDCRSLRFA